MQTYNLEQGCTLEVSDLKFFDGSRYNATKIFFPNLSAKKSIVNVPLVGFDNTGQIRHIRVTSSSPSVKFTLHNIKLEKAFPLGIILEATTKSYDEAANEIWTQWWKSSENILYVSIEELAGVDAVEARVLLIACP